MLIQGDDILTVGAQTKESCMGAEGRRKQQKGWGLHGIKGNCLQLTKERTHGTQALPELTKVLSSDENGHIPMLNAACNLVWAHDPQ